MIQLYLRKCFRSTLLVCFIIVIFINLTISCIALETGFDINKITKDEQTKIWENLQVSISFNNPGNSKSIKCFNINEKGYIALGFTDNSISIYDKSGIFQYSFLFSTYGSYYVDWSNENIVLILIREKAAIEIDKNGELKDMYKFTNNTRNYDYLNNYIKATTRTYENNTYEIQNTNTLVNFISAQSYSQLVKNTEKNSDLILYDSSKNHNIKIITFLILIIIFISIIIIIVLKRLIKLFRK